MSTLALQINRAPVLTLWGSVVAERLGFDHDAALTLGKAVAGLNAQSKGRRLGLFQPAAKAPGERREKKDAERIELMGRAIPVASTPAGVRAVVKDAAVTPESVERYLEGKFGAHLTAVRKAMAKLAAAFAPEELAERAFGLYEEFRPEIPAGVRGWGAAGTLDLRKLDELGTKRG
jgi:hypothetical protein